MVLRREGSGADRLVAYAVPRRGAGATGIEGDDLRGWLRQRLPDHMVPAGVVLLGALPLTANGKLDRYALPAPESVDPDADYVAPRDETERLLSRGWCEVLGVERVGVEDDFFRLGGDSILAIQLVGRCNRAGLRLTPDQLFRHPTIAELARQVAESTGDAGPEHGEATGPYPLTPVQRWFFSLGASHPEHWNQSLLLATGMPLRGEPLRRALAALLEHHDALRSRFEADAVSAGEGRVEGAGAAPPAVHGVDLRGLPEGRRARALTAVASHAQASLDLARGPLVRAVWFEVGETAGAAADTPPRRLLLVAHHLVVDGVSWRILLEDLERAYGAVTAGEPPALPLKTTPFADWARHLAALAEEGLPAAEVEHWRAVTAAPVPSLIDGGPLPRDPGSVGAAATLSGSLEEAATEDLLRRVPHAYNTRIDDVLLTALALAAARRGAGLRTRVELEGHGRFEDEVPGSDLSRTVGWFTVHYPVLLDLGGEGAGAALRQVKETLRRVPRKGLGFGLLTPPGARPEGAIQPELRFNYLGQLDRALADGSVFTGAPEGAGPSRHPDGPRPRPLEMLASVSGGRLQASLSYNPDAYPREAVEAFLQEFLDALADLVTHCLAVEAPVATPSDYPLADLDAAGLERIMEEAVAGSPEDVYPLTPLQENLLFHVVSSPHSDVGFEQSATVLRGELDHAAFDRAWEQVVERHPVLRTRFVTGGEGPLQVVEKAVGFAVRHLDWRDSGGEERGGERRELLDADRRRGFDLSRPPLMRVTLVRLADDVHELVWSYSHLILDGWCRGIVLKEVFALYDACRRGEEPALPGGRPYRDYVAWLQGRDREASEAFWRRFLAGVRRPTPVRVDRLSPVRPGAGYEYVDHELGRGDGEALTRVTGERGLTLNTLVQGAWALTLAQLAGVGGGDADVVHGITVSGRPPDLAGSDGMLGMFINNLPVRTRVSLEADLHGWLRGLQEDLAELRAHEHSAPDQVREWSDVAGGRRLFDSLVLFQNYPVGEVGQELTARSLEVEAYEFRLETGYPLTLVAGPGGGSLMLRLYHDASRVPRGAATALLANLSAFLLAMARAAEDTRLADLAVPPPVPADGGPRPDTPARPVSDGLRITPAEAAERLARDDAGHRGESWLLTDEAPGRGLVRELERAGVRPWLALGDGGPVVRLDAASAPVLAASPPLGLRGRWGGAAPVGAPAELVWAEGGELRATGWTARSLAVDGDEALDGGIEPLLAPGEADLPHLAGEVAALLRRHEAVCQAVALPVEESGAGVAAAPVLHAWVVLTPGEPVAETRGRLARHLAAHLPAADRPRSLQVVPELPRGADGSLDRGAVRALEPAAGDDGLTPPRGPVEELLAADWCGLLGLPMVGRDEDFFALGGHSLLAMRLVARARERFGVDLELRSLFETPTVAGVAARVRTALAEGDVGGGDGAIPEIPRRGGPYPLSYAQERLWFMHRLDPETGAYNIARALRIRGDLEVGPLAAAFAALVRRHESLRTIFPRSMDDTPGQRILPPRPPALPRVDLSRLGEGAEAEARRSIDEEAARPFDLARGPLLRLRLYRLQAGDHLLLVNLHHVVADGWSLDVVSREVAVLYQHAVAAAGKPSAAPLPAPLPPLPIQYVDYAAWQRDSGWEARLRQDVEWWRSRLADLPSSLPLPFDRPPRAGLSFAGRDLEFQLDAEVTRRLVELSRDRGTTLFMTLLAAFKVLLARETGTTDIFVGTDLAGRDRVELESLIGFFINHLVLRTDCSGNPSFLRLLDRVRETTLSSYLRREVPFDLLVKELGVERREGRAPLFQTLFVLQNTPATPWPDSRLDVAAMEPEGTSSKFDLSLFLGESRRGLLGRWRYRTELFDAATVERLSRRYRHLLADLVERPEALLSQLRLEDPEAAARREEERQEGQRRKLQKLRGRRR